MFSVVIVFLLSLFATPWNVNGIRSVLNKNALAWAFNANPDAVCLQEVKNTNQNKNTSGFLPCGVGFVVRQAHQFVSQAKGWGDKHQAQARSEAR
ncbi:MAG: hypothetical protein UZ14_CFX002002057 [Chloroflexi bacterium OLB14]|nr:MAG: hypothetical protein UZ14_CFX002002057 [Chloroflexi bacterium OLB14]